MNYDYDFEAGTDHPLYADDNVEAVEELKKESGIDENLEKSIWMIH